MKIRNDFVTNSSSSSFILGFTSENRIKDELLKDSMSILVEHIVLDDVLKAEKFGKEKVEKIIREELSYVARYRVMDKYEMDGYNFDFVHNYIDSVEGKKEIEKYIQDIVDKSMKRIKEDNLSVFVEVEYSDDWTDEQALERDIMPYLKSTVIDFSHHQKLIILVITLGKNKQTYYTRCSQICKNASFIKGQKIKSKLYWYFFINVQITYSVL